MGALQRLMSKNLNDGSVKKNTPRKKTKKVEKDVKKSAWSPSDEVKELQQKIIDRKNEQQAKKTKKQSLVKKKKDYEGFDTSGLTPGLAPVDYEESDSEDE